MTNSATLELRPLTRQVASAREASRIKQQFHIPSLDGIRAVAFLIVFISHAGAGHLVPGGYGVTVFFFLSGYLITSLLRHEHESTGSVNLKLFFCRRVVRIFPPMYITLVCVIAAAYAGFLPLGFQWDGVFAQSVYMTNFYSVFVPNASYPAGSGVLWSLAVEEHFYLVFPLLYFLLSSRIGRGQLVVVLLCLCGAVLAWRCYLVFGLHVHLTNPCRTYMASETRIDSILFGCILALWNNPYMDQSRRVGFPAKYGWLALGIGLTSLSFLYRDTAFRESFRYTVQGIALLPMFYFAISDSKHVTFSWLNTRWIKSMGVLSYSLYLIHHSAIHATQRLLPGSNAWFQAAAALFFSVGFAWAMHQIVEKPCARLRRQLRNEHRSNARQVSRLPTTAARTVWHGCYVSIGVGTVAGQAHGSEASGCVVGKVVKAPSNSEPSSRTAHGSMPRQRRPSRLQK